MFSESIPEIVVVRCDAAAVRVVETSRMRRRQRAKLPSRAVAVGPH